MPHQDNEQTQAENNKQNSSSRITDAILLALASAGAYLCSFLYERGYTGYFGIPQEFINVSLVNLLIFGAGIISLLWAIFAFFDVIFPFLRPKHPYLTYRVPSLAILFLLTTLLPFLVFGWIGIWFFSIFLSIWFLAIFIFLIWPLIVHRKSGNWATRYDKQLEKLSSQTNSIEPSTLQNFIGTRLGNRHLGFLIYLAFQSLFFINLAGITKAEKQEEFLVTNTSPAMVVLRVYGDNMICAPFDSDKHEVKKSFSIHKIAEDPKLVMNLEKVGPLKPVDKLASESLTPTPTPTPEPTPSVSPTPSPVSPSPTASPVQDKPIVN